MMIDVIRYRKVFLSIATILVVAGLASILTFGFRQGVEFRGGALWSFRTGEEKPDEGELQNIFALRAGKTDVRISYNPDTGVTLTRLPETSEEEHRALREALEDKYSSFEERSFQSIGPSIGRKLKKDSLVGLVLVLFGISLYVAFAFRKVYQPVSSWKYGVITLLTLAHDVIIPAGFLAVMGRFAGIELDSSLVVALLVIMGFSVHDTIVVFDRIRENLLIRKGNGGFGETINGSLNQVVARSVNTSLTLVLVIVALLFAGPEALRYFLLVLLIGVVSGVYSSIFVASPLLYVAERFSGGGKR